MMELGWEPFTARGPMDAQAWSCNLMHVYSYNSNTYVKILPMDSLCGCTCSAKLHVFMLLGVVCGQSHFVPLRLWSIDVYHLVLFLSADSSTGFGSQLEEIVTQGAMLESQYETPTCNLLVHYLHPFLFSTRKGETCHDSNGIFMGSCMHM